VTWLQTVANNSAVVLEYALHQDKALNTVASNASLAQCQDLLSLCVGVASGQVNAVGEILALHAVQATQAGNTSSAKTSQIVFPDLSAQSLKAPRLLVTLPQQ
jgi:hypothetical protein